MIYISCKDIFTRFSCHDIGEYNQGNVQPSFDEALGDLSKKLYIWVSKLGNFYLDLKFSCDVSKFH